jgi:hypothetical protein
MYAASSPRLRPPGTCLTARRRTDTAGPASTPANNRSRPRARSVRADQGLASSHVDRQLHAESQRRLRRTRAEPPFWAALPRWWGCACDADRDVLPRGPGHWSVAGLPGSAKNPGVRGQDSWSVRRGGHRHRGCSRSRAPESAQRCLPPIAMPPLGCGLAGVPVGGTQSAGGPGSGSAAAAGGV